MRRYTKYFLVKKSDYLSNGKRPVFNLQLNYGKPKVSNTVSFQANEYLSRNKEVVDKQNGTVQAGPSVPQITNRNSPVFSNKNETGETSVPSKGWTPSIQETRKTSQNSTLNDSQYYNNEGGDDGNDFQPEEIETEHPELTPEIDEQLTNLENLLNETNKTLDRVERGNTMSLKPNEQLDELQNTIERNDESQFPSYLSTYRDTKNESLDDSADMSSLPLTTQDTTMKDPMADLADQFRTAPLNIKTPQKTILNQDNSTLNTPVNQVSDLIRINQLRGQSTPRKPKKILLDSLDQSVIKKPDFSESRIQDQSTIYPAKKT